MPQNGYPPYQNGNPSNAPGIPMGGVPYAGQGSPQMPYGVPQGQQRPQMPYGGVPMQPQPTPQQGTKKEYASGSPEPDKPSKKSTKETKAEAKQSGKKVIKPISAGKGFALGLVAAFIMMLIFSLVLILYSMMSDSARESQYNQMLDDARVAIQDMTTNVTLSPTEGTMTQAIGYNANIEATTGGDDPKTIYGAGIIWSSDGNILTNNHVVAEAEQITVTYKDVKYPATVVGTDPTSDLAVIKINAKDLTPAQLADSATVSAGDWVMSIGNPYGLNDTVSSGIVSQTGRNDMLQDGQTTVLYANMIQTDAAINPGSSGGGLYNASGQLIGVTTIITSSDDGNQGIGYAIPANYVRSITTDIINGDAPRHADMGITVADVSEDEQNRFGLPDRRGASIQNVVASGPAANAGIVNGDIITDFGGVEVQDAQDLRYMIRARQIGDTVDVKILREGHEMTMQLRLGADA